MTRIRNRGPGGPAPSGPADAFVVRPDAPDAPRHTRPMPAGVPAVAPAAGGVVPNGDSTAGEFSPLETLATVELVVRDMIERFERLLAAREAWQRRAEAAAGQVADATQPAAEARAAQAEARLAAIEAHQQVWIDLKDQIDALVARAGEVDGDVPPPSGIQGAAAGAAPSGATGMLQECLPFGRFDGYWALADLTRVPDFFSLIGPYVRSVVPLRRCGGIDGDCRRGGGRLGSGR
ncbi:MAG: hypothetical protein HY332_10625 [Chloroflexi bacterium]|nr:hypothetical protein [Chloroflexota bacterium]